MKLVWVAMLLSGCALSVPSVSISDHGTAFLPSERRAIRWQVIKDRQEAREYAKAHDEPAPRLPPRRAKGTLETGWLRFRSGYHDFLWVFFRWEF